VNTHSAIICGLARIADIVDIAGMWTTGLLIETSHIDPYALSAHPAQMAQMLKLFDRVFGCFGREMSLAGVWLG